MWMFRGWSEPRPGGGPGQWGREMQDKLLTRLAARMLACFNASSSLGLRGLKTRRNLPYDPAPE
jgi:hypothetical protein